MNVKTDHRAAGTFIDINTFYIQRVNSKNVAMSFAFRRRCAIVPGFTKIGACLEHAIRDCYQTRAKSLRQYTGISG